MGLIIFIIIWSILFSIAYTLFCIRNKVINNNSKQEEKEENVLLSLLFPPFVIMFCIVEIILACLGVIK